MAYQLMRVPEMVISGPIYLAILTAVAQAPNQQAARVLVFSSFRILLTALVLTFCGVSLTADLVIHLLLGTNWSDTGPVLAALAPAGFFVCLYSFSGAVLLGSGNSRQQFKLTLLCSLAMVVGAVIGSQFGPSEVALGISLGAAALAPLYLRSLARELRASLASFALTSVAPLTAACVMILTVSGVRMEIAELPVVVQLGISVAAGFLSFAAVVALLGGRKFLGDLRRMRPQAAELDPELQPTIQVAQTLEVSR
jgi:PST family polysaccharide transporter